MKSSNVVTAYKSSLIGLAFIIYAGVAHWTGKITDYWILGAIVFVGLGFMFSGDGFIHKLEKAVFGTELFKPKDKDKPVE